MKFIFLIISFILINIFNPIKGQITQSQSDLFRDKAESLIKNYEAGLNNIGSIQNSISQKELCMRDIITTNFENNKARVYNDIEPEGALDYEIQTYLNNIITWYPTGIKFQYNIDTVSKVFHDKKENFLFIKATVKEKVEGNSNKGIKISDNFINDFYIKQNIWNKYVISNISKHEDNLDSFTPAYISDTIPTDKTSQLEERIEFLSKKFNRLQNGNPGVDSLKKGVLDIQKFNDQIYCIHKTSKILEFFTIGFFVTSAAFGIMSLINYQNYKQSTNPKEIEKYYNNAEKYRKRAGGFFLAGSVTLSFDFYYLFKKNRKK